MQKVKLHVIKESLYLVCQSKENMNTQEKIKSIFPEFKKSDEFVEKLLELSSEVHLEAGTKIVDTGDYIKSIPFLLNGLVKIYREDEEGNEILLYYIKNGESCVMSMTTCLKNETSSIKAIVEEDSSILILPSDHFNSLLKEYNLLHLSLIHI